MSRKETFFCDFCGADMDTEYGKFVLPARPRILLPNRYPKGPSAVPFIVDPEYREAPGVGEVALVMRTFDVCPKCSFVLSLYISDSLPKVRERLREGELRDFAQRMPGVYRGLEEEFKNK